METIVEFTGLAYGLLRRPVARPALALVVVIVMAVPSTTLAQEEREVFFGDTHVHTAWSRDANSRGGNKTTDPVTAYRYAIGLPIIHPLTKAKIQNPRPLDFLAVTDHAEFLGMYAYLGEGEEPAELPPDRLERLGRTLWGEYVAMADRYNDPGRFTALIGWEWTSTPNGMNLHRVILTPDDGEVARRFRPYSSIDSGIPEDLWAWLERTSPETGARFIAIPHNSNTSGGLMFEETDSDGRPITVDYARTRARWEPVVEVTQVKGDSETHPVLSPTDEFADFERYRWFFTGEPLVARPGGFVRSALLRGLALEAKLGVNPYKLGMIGSSDAHMGYSEVSESNFSGKFPIDSIPENKRVKIGVVPLGWELSSTGLAAVWAEENTREALFQAFQRREVYATTGTRLRVRFFGGWSFDEEDASARDLAEIGYRRGVPMGGDLTAVPEGSSPSFLVQAVKDPLAANLDRVQIVKGWLDDQGNVHEKIYDVAWAGDRAPDADGHLSAVGNTVDISTARYANTIGAIELATTWADPDFNPNERAFYYVRVLEIPTPRHSLYDAVALGIDPPPDFPATIQERAYTSPIWYTPQP